MHIRNMQQQQEDCTMDIRIKYIEDQFRKSGTTFVTEQQTGGSTLDIIDKTPLEKVIIEENVKVYRHTEGACPLLSKPQLYSDIGGFGEGP